jgi:hypothetical protein
VCYTTWSKLLGVADPLAKPDVIATITLAHADATRGCPVATSAPAGVDRVVARAAARVDF